MPHYKEECNSLWLGEDKVFNNKLKSIERYTIITRVCGVCLETSASSKVLMGIESLIDLCNPGQCILWKLPGFRHVGSSNVDWKFQCFVFYTKV
jgi:hypothetical protein